MKQKELDKLIAEYASAGDRHVIHILDAKRMLHSLHTYNPETEEVQPKGRVDALLKKCRRLQLGECDCPARKTGVETHWPGCPKARGAHNPDTHVVVPREPTKAMMEAYQSAFVSEKRFDMREVWQAMLATSEQEPLCPECGQPKGQKEGSYCIECNRINGG